MLAGWMSVRTEGCNSLRSGHVYFIHVSKVAKIRLLYVTCLSGCLSVRLSAFNYSIHVEKIFAKIWVDVLY